MTIPCQRHLFDVPENIAYFNCAYHGVQLNASRDRLIAGLQQNSHPWERTPISFFEDAETIRGLAAQLFGGDADGYAIVPAVSYGVSTAARILEPRLRRGDAILVIAEEFPSDVLPWRRVAAERGAELITVPAPTDGNWTAAIVERIDRNVKVVSTSTCHWTNGARIELGAVRARCNEVGATLIVDASQTLGAMPLSIPELDPDFLVSVGYKWMLGPYGCGLLYVAERWRNARPLEESWLARVKAENFNSLANYQDEYMRGARRFDVGEKGSRTVLPGMIAALEQLQRWEIPKIAESIAAINCEITAFLESLEFSMPKASQRCPHLFGAKLPKSFRGDLVNELKGRHIYISQRGDSLRFAPHLHVNEHDIARLTEALRDLVTS